MTGSAAEAVGVYLYAVTRGLDEGDLAQTIGAGGGPVRVLIHQGLQAVVSEVDLDEFGEEALKQNLEDMTWLENVARAHHDVVYAVSQAGTVAPMRLVTILADHASVCSRVESLHEPLTAALDRVEGRGEWSVKVFTAPPSAGAASRPSARAEGESGADYLRRKRADADRRKSADEGSLELAQNVHDRLAAAADASRLLAPQDPRLTGRQDVMVLNGAYLVELDSGGSFSEVIERLRVEHPDLTVVAEGPWPPYSFATLEQP